MTSSDHPRDQADRSPAGIARVNADPVRIDVRDVVLVDGQARVVIGHLTVPALQLDAIRAENITDIRLFDPDDNHRAGLIRMCAKAVLGEQAALALVDQLLAAGEHDQAEAVVRLVVAGVPPVLVDARMAALAARLGDALDHLVLAFDDAADTLRSLVDSLPDTPPSEPRARALWLRQHRNTGPQPARRAPRALNPRRNR